jgi:hypothetical protein
MGPGRKRPGRRGSSQLAAIDRIPSMGPGRKRPGRHRLRIRSPPSTSTFNGARAQAPWKTARVANCCKLRVSVWLCERLGVQHPCGSSFGTASRSKSILEQDFRSASGSRTTKRSVFSSFQRSFRLILVGQPRSPLRLSRSGSRRRNR